MLLYEIMHQINMIMITCVMKAKDNIRIILLYEKVQLNVHKRLFDNEYLISIHDISSYSCIRDIFFLIPKTLLRKYNKTDCLLMTG